MIKKKPLTQRELEVCLLESEESDGFDFSSDDDIKDRTFDPDKVSSDSESSDDDPEDETPVNDLPVVQDPHTNINDNVPIDDEENWTDTDLGPIEFPFTGAKQFTSDLPLTARPIQYFLSLFDDEIFERITDETNRRAHLDLNSKITRSSREKKWKDIDVMEMKKFIGVCMLSGTVHFPLLAKQWSRHPIYFHPIFGRTTSRNRFQMILKNLRFVDHTAIDSNDKLFKIRPILEKVLQNIKKIFSPGKNLSIDEAMIGWKGRLSFRQYISNKRHKYGIKLYEVTTDDGFILDVIVYTGKGTIVEEDSSHVQSVVKKLLKDFVEKGHTVYLDNFYTSVPLAEYLFKKKTTLVGTIRENRKGNHKPTMNTKLKKGEVVWKRKGPVLLTNWRDKRNVRMISTAHGHRMIETQSKRGVMKTKPKCVLDYNEHMSGIDKADQMMAYYSTPRKTIRWYRKIFFHLVDLSVWNACYLYNFHQNKNIRLLEFREKIIMDLIDNPDIPERVDQHDTINTFHFLEPNPPTEKDRSAMRRCRQCTCKNDKKKLDIIAQFVQKSQGFACFHVSKNGTKTRKYVNVLS